MTLCLWPRSRRHTYRKFAPFFCVYRLFAVDIVSAFWPLINNSRPFVSPSIKMAALPLKKSVVPLAASYSRDFLISNFSFAIWIFWGLCTTFHFSNKKNSWSECWKTSHASTSWLTNIYKQAHSIFACVIFICDLQQQIGRHHSKVI